MVAMVPTSAVTTRKHDRASNFQMKDESNLLHNVGRLLIFCPFMVGEVEMVHVVWIRSFSAVNSSLGTLGCGTGGMGEI